MKRIALAALALALLSSCETVRPGYVGIKVNNVGANRGVQDAPIVVGRVFYNPFTESIYIYPTFSQNYVWSASSTEGKPHDESIGFNAAGGVSFSSDVGVVLAVRDSMVPKLFTHYRRPIEELIDTVIRNEVRDAFNRAAGRFQPIDIMATRKAELLDSVRADLRRGPLSRFVDFQTISFVAAPRPAAQIQDAITAVFAANQAAAQAQQVVAEARYKAEQVVATARGDSASAVIQAQGTAEANRRIAMSLSPAVIQWQYLNKWNGVVPVVSGSAGTLVQLPGVVK